MILVEDNTEERLIQLLDSIKGRLSPYRFLWIQTSKIDSGKVDRKTLSNIIKGVVMDDTLKIYVCDDNDIFIIAQLVNAHTLEKLNLYISTFLGIPSLEPILYVYELPNDWTKASIVCEDKLNKMASQAAAKKVSTQTTNINLNPELIKKAIQNRKARSKPHIMVVEDDSFSRKLISGALSKEYMVTQAKDGREALQKYSLHGPNVMFLDIELPDMNGHNILNKIISLDPEAYIVMLSGKGDKDNVLQSIKEGAKGFVGKPFSKEKLLQYINQCPTIN